MNIAIILPGFSRDEHDWGIPVLRHLVGALAQREHVRVLALRYPHRRGRYRAFGAEVIPLGGANRRGWGSVHLWVRALSVLRQEHRRQPFDIFHAFWANETGMVAAVAGQLLGVPVIVSLAGGELVGLKDIAYGGQLRVLERFKVSIALRKARCVTGGSKYILSLAEKTLGSPPPCEVKYIPLGVPLKLFHPGKKRTPPSPPKLVHVASLTAVKDQVTLLRAANILKVEGLPFTLEIAGSGEMEHHLRSLTEKLHLSDKVVFRGWVAHHHLPEFYRAGSLFVLSSRHEAQCMSALEAAACGLPLVGTEVGILPELAPEAAAVVPIQDAEALAEAMAAVFTSPIRLQSLGQAAQARVAAAFSLQQTVERLRELYRCLP